MKYAFSSAMLAAVLAACASDNSNSVEPASNGVNDVLAACQLRAAWQHPLADTCAQCKGLAITAYCSCFHNPASAKCETQENAKKAEPTCEGTDLCVDNCHNDCACIDKCYTGKDACRRAASAVDGCVAAVCDQDCR